MDSSVISAVTCHRCGNVTSDTKFKLCVDCKNELRKDFSKDPFPAQGKHIVDDRASAIRREFMSIQSAMQELQLRIQSLYMHVAKILPMQVSILDDEPGSPEILEKYKGRAKYTSTGNVDDEGPEAYKGALDRVRISKTRGDDESPRLTQADTAGIKVHKIAELYERAKAIAAAMEAGAAHTSDDTIISGDAPPMESLDRR